MTSILTDIWNTQLSQEQTRFHYLHQLDPNSPEIYVTWKVTIRGSLNLEALTVALEAVVRGNPILRAFFPIRGNQPVICLRAPWAPEIAVVDLGNLPAEERAHQLGMAVDVEATQRPFSLEEGPLFKVMLFRLGQAEQVLLLRLHHLICDNQGMQNFIRALLSAYEEIVSGRKPETAAGSENAPHYGQFIGWETARNTPPACDSRNRYWQKKLRSAAAAGMESRGSRKKSVSSPARTLRFTLPPEESEALVRGCERLGVVEFTALLAVFQILLQHLRGKAEQSVGSPMSARGFAPEFRKMLGTLVNWGVFRTRIDPTKPFKEFLALVNDDFAETRVNADSVLNLISAAKGSGPQSSSNPLFQYVLNVVKIHRLPEIQGLRFETETVPYQSTHFDLTMKLENRVERSGEKSGLFDVMMTYSTEAFSHEAAEAVLRTFREMILHFLQDGTKTIESFQSPSLVRAKASSVPEQPTRLLAIASTFAAEPLEPALNFWFNKIDLPCAIEIEPINQVFRSLLDPASGLTRAGAGVNAILLRFEDWKDPAAHAREFAAILKESIALQKRPMIVVACPPTAKWRQDAAMRAAHQGMEERLHEALRELPQVHLITEGELSELYPVQERDDLGSEDFATIPYTPEFYIALSSMLARKVHVFSRQGPKVLVLDCDNTLWKGVVGEDGVAGLSVDPGRSSLQRFAQAQQEAGMLLCLCSKNNEADVWEVFEKHPEMKLRRDQIVAHRINWDAKSGNIESLARELDLGTDSFVFIDDSEAECAEVRANNPDVQVFLLPADSEMIPTFLKHLWCFDRAKTTDTDRQRTQLYQQNALRENLRKSTGNLDQFIDSLQVQVSFPEISHALIPRLSQMTLRTNQFNFTTIRRSEAEIAALARDAEVGLLAVEVSDRFGDYGLVGLVIHRRRNPALEVDTFLLSCRALGRGVEQRIIRRLGELATEEGLLSVDLPLAITSKNTPARQFLERSFPSCRITVSEGKEYLYQIPAAVARKQAIQPMEIEFIEEKSKAVNPGTAPATFRAIPPETWRQIAMELNDVSTIATKLGERLLHKRPDSLGGLVSPANPLERTIAEVWRDVLCVNEVSVNDAYFSLGGDSIRSLQIALNLRKAGHQVSPLDLLRFNTVAKLAGAISTRADPLFTARERITHASGPYPLGINQAYLVDRYACENGTAGHSISGAYHIQNVIPLRQKAGVISEPAIRLALRELAAAHPLIRSHALHSATGSMISERAPAAAEEVPFHDLRGLAPREQDHRILEMMKLDRLKPFDPFNPVESPMRVRIILRSCSSFALFLSAHHGFFDGWGLQQYYSDFLRLYFGFKDDDQAEIDRVRSELEKGRFTFRELVELEQESARSELNHQFWKQYLAETGRELATQAPGEPLPAEADHHLSRMLSSHLIHRIMSGHRSLKVSAKAVFLTAFLELAMRKHGQRNVVVAVVSNGRSEHLTGSLRALGLFWNFVPMISETGPEKAGLIQLIQERLNGVEGHNRMPLARMLGGRDPEEVIMASFNFLNFHNSGWRNGGSRYEIGKTISFHKFHFPLNLTVSMDTSSGLTQVSANWNRARYNRQNVKTLLDDYAGILAELLEETPGNGRKSA